MGYIRVPLVSLQRVGPGDAVERHVVRGVLVGPDAVVVPVPDEGLGDGVREWFEVLLASPGDRTWNLERIGVDRIELTRVAGFTGAVATVQLAAPSLHATFAGEFEPARLVEAADGTADLWETLVAIGFVPRHVLADPTAALGRVADAEARLARGRLPEREYASAVVAANVFCCNWFVHKCCRRVHRLDVDGPGGPGGPGDPDGPDGAGSPAGPVLLEGPVFLDGPVPPVP